MRSYSGKEFAKLLERNGWTLKGIRGSHHVYMKEGLSARISVPIHGNRSLKAGLLRHLMKLSGIRESDPE